MRVIDAVREIIADVSSASPSPEQMEQGQIICSGEGLALETSAIISLTASITLINTQLTHQFVFRRADVVLLRAAITLFVHKDKTAIFGKCSVYGYL